MGICSSVWIDIAFIKCSTVVYKEYRGYLIYRIYIQTTTVEYSNPTVKDLIICYNFCYTFVL